MSEGLKLFDAGDYNLFRYCHNDPIDNVDPMGLQGEATGLLQSGTNDRVWDMTKWFDSSNIIQGMFSGFASMSGQSDRDAKGLSMAYVNQGEAKMYTYSLKSQYDIGALSGARGYQYVWDPNPNYSGQCMTTVQHLSGAPSSATPLLRGDPVGPNTKRGTAIATGFRNVNGQCIYPSKSPNEFKSGERINHAAFYVAPTHSGYMQTLEAQRGVPLHLERSQPMAGWYEIKSRVPPSAASTSQLRQWDGPIPW